MNFRKFFLYLLIGSVTVSALFGIAVMLLGNFGEFETKVLLTAVAVTVTSVMGLMCGAYLEARGRRAISIVGIDFALISLVMWVFLVWYGTMREGRFTEFLMSATLLAASCSIVSLLSLATLDSRFRWSRVAVHIVVWSLTAILLWIIWTHFDPSENWVARLLGVLSILLATLTIVTPVFHKLSQAETTDDEIDAEIERLRARIAELEAKKTAITGESE